MATIGVQLMTVKEKVATEGMFGVLGRIAELGYGSVEVSQVATDEANIAALERGRDELGVQVAAMSVGLQSGPTNTGDALDADFDRIVENCRRLSCRHVRIGMMPFAAMASKTAVIDFARRAEESAQRLAPEGITLSYHNHHVDFAKHDGETLFDTVHRVAPSLHLEIDVHWVQRGGRDPVTVLREYADRTELVHLKDYRVGLVPQEAVDRLMAGDFTAFMQAFAGLVQFAEVGAGTLDFASIVPTAIAGGAEHLLVEQDDLYGRDAWDCLADSRAHLRALGF